MEERENKEEKINTCFANYHEQVKKSCKAEYDWGYWTGFSIGALVVGASFGLELLILSIGKK